MKERKKRRNNKIWLLFMHGLWIYTDGLHIKTPVYWFGIKYVYKYLFKTLMWILCCEILIIPQKRIHINTHSSHDILIIGTLGSRPNFRYHACLKWLSSLPQTVIPLSHLHVLYINKMPKTAYSSQC